MIIAIDPGIRNLAISFYNQTDGFYKLLVLDITEGAITNVNKTPVKNLIDHLVKFFNKCLKPEFEGAAKIIIEQQLSKSIKMTSIMWSLYVLCKNMCNHVYLQQAYKKNEVLAFQRGRSYNTTKKLSIEIVQKLMDEKKVPFSDDAIQTFKKSKKKDDVADSIIHVIVHEKIAI